MTALFGHGELRLLLLGALADGSHHGYELMRLLEDRLAGLYRPSAGTIYPRLAAMEDEGLVTHDAARGRKVFRLTAAGRREIEQRADDLAAVERMVSARVRRVTATGRDGRRTTARSLRDELRRSMQEARAGERRAARNRENSAPGDHAVRALRMELRIFAVDVEAAARRSTVDPRVLPQVASILDDARARILDTLGDPPGSFGP